MLSTPQKDADKLLRKKQVNGDVRKALQFGSAVFLAIKERYQKSKSHKEKQFIAKIVAKRIRKYRMAKTAHAMLGIPQEAVMIRDDCLLRYNRKTHVSSCRRLSTTVDKFFCREDNSRTTTGKRDTVSKGGIKKQRRLLLDTLSRLYNKYTLENPWSHMSYSLFCTMRPFFVVSPTNKDRETCLCKVHENSRMLIEKLNNLKRLPHNVNTVDTCVDAAVCTMPTRSCYERRCDGCKDNLKFGDVENLQDTVTWEQWETVKEERVIKGKNVVIQRCVKQTKAGTHLELQNKFEAILSKLCWHIMVMRHQYLQYQTIKEKDTCTMIVDFSENYTCGHNRAIQASHFGASNIQLTLHTGVAYTRSKTLSFLQCFRVHSP